MRTKKKLGHNYYDDQHQILDRLGLEGYNLFFILSSAYNVHVLWLVAHTQVKHKPSVACFGFSVFSFETMERLQSKMKKK